MAPSNVRFYKLLGGKQNTNQCASVGLFNVGDVKSDVITGCHKILIGCVILILDVTTVSESQVLSGQLERLCYTRTGFRHERKIKIKMISVACDG